MEAFSIMARCVVARLEVLPTKQSLQSDIEFALLPGTLAEWPVFVLSGFLGIGLLIQGLGVVVA